MGDNPNNTRFPYTLDRGWGSFAFNTWEEKAELRRYNLESEKRTRYDHFEFEADVHDPYWFHKQDIRTFEEWWGAYNRGETP